MSAKGTNTHENQGIASAFTSGLISGSEANNTPSATTDSNDTAHCPSSAKRQPRLPSSSRPNDTHSKAATKPNESQKPTLSAAAGAISSTSAKACHQPRHTEAPLPRHHAQAKASSINTLRFVGTEKPAKPA